MRPRPAVTETRKPIRPRFHETSARAAILFFYSARKRARSSPSVASGETGEAEYFTLRISERCVLRVFRFSVAWRSLQGFLRFRCPPNLNNPMAFFPGRKMRNVFVRTERRSEPFPKRPGAPGRPRPGPRVAEGEALSPVVRARPSVPVSPPPPRLCGRGKPAGESMKGSARPSCALGTRPRGPPPSGPSVRALPPRSAPSRASEAALGRPAGLAGRLRDGFALRLPEQREGCRQGAQKLTVRGPKKRSE